MAAKDAQGLFHLLSVKTVLIVSKPGCMENINYANAALYSFTPFIHMGGISRGLNILLCERQWRGIQDRPRLQYA